ncbi:bis(5'-nucleosyl)-tetraphosphatase (symmetrical) YqeK [Vaginisenegalia massiliensis]|uniref:bis(5'-nucleosyl)-tetraphosphatase (symmetrical) YqeK n=1 Tax=Vaginisenegalia massiliensis TaxID=2058294 RepID=UPI0013DDB832|nr:bis(5'-nucleosyl)-tetraphosphatase (symmetrical) YqeK [Vaginisenegalia massiliensis]
MSKKIEYQKGYINCSREDLLNKTQKQMKDSRFKHILRVEETALKLAKQHNYSDLEAVSVAAILHDYAKEMPKAEMLPLAQKFWNHPDLPKASDGVWHGLAAATIAQESFACQHEGILKAIAGHTIGWHEMDVLAQLIYLADYIEPARDFPGVDQARLLAKDSLVKATTFEMVATLQHLLSRQIYIFPGTLDIYNNWIQQQN